MTDEEKARLCANGGTCAGAGGWPCSECPLKEIKARHGTGCGLETIKQFGREWLNEHASPSAITGNDVAKLRQIASGNCRGIDCGCCPLHDFRHNDPSDPCMEGPHDGNNLSPRAIAKAREMLGEAPQRVCVNIETSMGVDPHIAESYSAAIMAMRFSPPPPSFCETFSVFRIGESITEKRRAMRRRILGL